MSESVMLHRYPIRYECVCETNGGPHANVVMWSVWNLTARSRGHDRGSDAADRQSNDQSGGKAQFLQVVDRPRMQQSRWQSRSPDMPFMLDRAIRMPVSETDYRNLTGKMPELSMLAIPDKHPYTFHPAREEPGVNTLGMDIRLPDACSRHCRPCASVSPALAALATGISGILDWYTC